MTDSASAMNSYDEVPYDSKAYSQTHIRRLEAVATIFGMRPTPIHQARVLELGCAGGHNLAPQAQDYAQSSFVGIDYSQMQITAAQDLSQRLGLANLEFKHASILDLDPSWGKFDYIICHGVYSWVPPEVRQKILSVMRGLLAPQGVGHISYNVYPGCHMRMMIRQMMAYHTAPIVEPAKKVEQARGLLSFIAEVTPSTTAFGMHLRNELDIIRQTDASYLYHEHLEENNEPLYFHQFAARLAENDLQFLGEANFASMLVNSLPTSAQEKLATLPLIQQQQYIDFVRNRPFRESLICHKEVALHRRLSAESVRPFHVWLAGKLEMSNIDLASHAPATFTYQGTTFTVPTPMVKAALACLGEIRPRPIKPEDLQAAAIARLPTTMRPSDADLPKATNDLRATLLLGMCHGLVEFAVHPPEYAAKLSAFPEATAMARLQAADDRSIVNRRHENVKLDAVGLHVLKRLDGQHGVLEIAKSMREALKKGDPALTKQIITPIDLPTAVGIVERTLATMQHHALLVK